MSFIQMNIFSEALGKTTNVNVIMPDLHSVGQVGVKSNVKGGKFKCLYLLHGLSDNNTNWSRRTSIERYASLYGIAVVMPDGAKSFYTDMVYGDKYYTYIAKELPKIICEIFNVSDKREDNHIAGLSMGGYGALKIGMKECDRFCKCAGLSSVADIRARRRFWPEIFDVIFGKDNDVPDSEDLFCIAKEVEKNPCKPDIYMVEGTEDYMYEDNIRLKKELEGLDINYTYKEAPGEHTWEFWDEHIQNVLKWMFEQN